MSRARLSAGVLLCALAALVGTAVGDGALVAVNNIVLRADGDFQPRTLPRRQFAPIHFHGHLDIDGKGGSRPPALEQAVVDFDRDGRLGAAGLPSCLPSQIENASPAEARETCAGAIVGRGQIEALIALPAGTVTARSPLTLFNGPRQESGATVVLHAQTTVPATQTFAIVVPIERRPGEFRYRATLDLPPIAAGLGSISRIAVDVGRRFSAGGKRRSYVSARCSDSVLRTHGHFLFSDGTIIDGSVEKPCTER